MNKRPLVGVAVIVKKNNRVLLGKRINAHGQGTWALPGGHLEWGETVLDCARRELTEETGISLKNLKSGPHTNDIFKTENKHYITLYVIADHARGKPRLMEPEKCAAWQWFDWDALPEPRFLPLSNLLKTGFCP